MKLVELLSPCLIIAGLTLMGYTQWKSKGYNIGIAIYFLGMIGFIVTNF